MRRQRVKSMAKMFGTDAHRLMRYLKSCGWDLNSVNDFADINSIVPFLYPDKNDLEMIANMKFGKGDMGKRFLCSVNNAPVGDSDFKEIIAPKKLAADNSNKPSMDVTASVLDQITTDIPVTSITVDNVIEEDTIIDKCSVKPPCGTGGVLHSNDDSRGDVFDEMTGNTYVFDTNVIVDKPQILANPKQNDRYIIPIIVMEELDSLLQKNKAVDQDVVNNIKLAYNYMEKNMIPGMERIKTASSDLSYLSGDYCQTKADNKILSIPLKFMSTGYQNVILITNDKNLRLKAKMEGINTMRGSDLMS